MAATTMSLTKKPKSRKATAPRKKCRNGARPKVEVIDPATALARAVLDVADAKKIDLEGISSISVRTLCRIAGYPGGRKKRASAG